ncbi:MAG TPA: ELWxxDGT repeat protein [Thermoanaerobaculia bacterium]
MLRVSAILLALLAGLSAAAPAATPAMVRDLDPRPHAPGTDGAIASQLTRAGSRAVFVHQDSGYAGESELWTTDGTAAGTERLRAFPGHLEILGSTGELVFFATPILVNHTYTAPSVLWRTDGTREGTVSLGAVPSFDPAAPPAAFSIVFHNVLLFSACTPAWGCELWRSDGSPAGTRRLREIVPGSGGSAPRLFASFGDLVYFFADDPAGIGLWRSDGTNRGTQRVLSLPPFSSPRSLFRQGSRLYFTEGVSSYYQPDGPDLWTTDGTAAGTRPVPPFDHARGGGPQVIWVFPGLGDRAVFFGVQGKGNYQLWITDGAARSAQPLTHLAPLPNGGELPIRGVGTTNGHLLFAIDGRLWTSRGSPAGTRPLGGCPGGCPTGVEIWDAPASGALAGQLLFSSGTPANTSLWVTDGTGAGTRKLVDLCTSSCGTAPALAWTALGKVFFFYQDQLWATDGSSGGTRPLADHPDQLSDDSSPLFVTLGGRVLFPVSSPDTGAGLWATDGTPAGTEPLATVEEGASSYPQGFLPFGGGVLFFTCIDGTGQPWSSDDGTQGLPGATDCRSPTRDNDPPRFLRLGDAAFFTGWTDDFVSRIWRTDGTPEGTAILFQPGADEYLAQVAVFRGKLFFTTVADAETRFWTSDGTAGGTTRIFSLPLRYVSGLTVAGDLLFFQAEDADGRTHDWVTDGTAAGTRPFVDVLANPPAPFIPFRGAFYFSGDGLWRTDGTPEGTTTVLPNDASPDPLFGIRNLISFAGSLFFIAQTGSPYDDQPHPYALFRSDGTALGTSSVKVLGVDPEYPSATPAVVAGSFLYFVAGEAEHGQELWRTDGTAAGTVLLSDVAPGPASSVPQELTADGDRLFFTADDGEHGRELWVTRGIPGDVRPVGRRTDGTLSLSPRELTISGDRLFFSADDGVNGRELWLLPLTPGDP